MNICKWVGMLEWKKKQHRMMFCESTYLTIGLNWYWMLFRESTYFDNWEKLWQVQQLLNLFAAIGHFAWHWARQWTDTHSFPLLHSQLWRSSTGRVLNLSDFLCFGDTGLGSGANTCRHVLAWRADYSSCVASEIFNLPPCVQNCGEYRKSCKRHF